MEFDLLSYDELFSGVPEQSSVLPPPKIIPLPVSPLLGKTSKDLLVAQAADKLFRNLNKIPGLFTYRDILDGRVLKKYPAEACKLLVEQGVLTRVQLVGSNAVRHCLKGEEPEVEPPAEPSRQAVLSTLSIIRHWCQKLGINTSQYDHLMHISQIRKLSGCLYKRAGGGGEITEQDVDEAYEAGRLAGMEEMKKRMRKFLLSDKV